jgi:hypothetical protein
VCPLRHLAILLVGMEFKRNSNHQRQQHYQSGWAEVSLVGLQGPLQREPLFLLPAFFSSKRLLSSS